MRRRLYRHHHRVGTTLTVCTDMGREVWQFVVKTEAVIALRHGIGRIA
jgi:hypothetical protein